MTLYQQLKASGNPQAPIQVIFSLLQQHNPKEVAEIMGVSVRWIYKILHRFKSSGGQLSACLLKRGPKKPMPNRTPAHIETLVLQLAKSTNFGPNRLSFVLSSSFSISLSPYTIRNILRRHNVRCRRLKTCNGQSRYFVDLNAFSPLQFWQFDTKFIADQHALPKEAYASIFRNKLPKYQFTAIDVKTRIRFIAFASAPTFQNGLTFMLLVAYWLRSFGVNHTLFFQTDNGSEFGGSATSRKRTLMQRFIFNHLDVSLLNIPPGQKYFNTYVERSHRTDDEEFYTVNLSNVTSRKDFFKMAQDWLLYFNYHRPHFGKGMKGLPPIKALHASRIPIHPAIAAFPVINLDLFSQYLLILHTYPGITHPKI